MFPALPERHGAAAELLDQDFLEHRAKLIDLAAFLDRLDRASDGPGAGAEDFRAIEFKKCLAILSESAPGRAARSSCSRSSPWTRSSSWPWRRSAHASDLRCLRVSL